LAVGVLGKTDTARISNAFKARGNVDAVAHQVAIALLDHVAQMDADAELDATLRRKTRVALDHAILHLDCAANGIDDASELYEDAVTRPLDDAAVMHGDGGIDQIASQRSEAGKCPLLVGPGKLAESNATSRSRRRPDDSRRADLTKGHAVTREIFASGNVRPPNPFQPRGRAGLSEPVPMG
jgi:hypothetical protein